MMKKVLVSGFLLCSVGAFASDEQPLNTSNISFTTSDCTTNPAPDAVLEIAATGGTQPYTFSLPGVVPIIAGNTAAFNLPPANKSAVVTITDSAAKPSSVQVAVEPLVTLGANVVLQQELSCSGVNLVLTLTAASSAQNREVQSIVLTSDTGFSQAITGDDLSNTGSFTFESLKPGKYTLVITPVPVQGIAAACNNAVTLTFPIAQTALAVSNVVNTTITNGGANGVLVVTFTGGTAPITLAQLKGPLPDAAAIIGKVDTVANTATFSGLTGGFYTLTLSDSTPNGTADCIVTQTVTVNFFADPASNRIALAYC